MQENGTKLSKEQVRFKMKPDPKKPDNQCKNCRSYQGKYACSIVNGLVSPNGVCTMFTK